MAVTARAVAPDLRVVLRAGNHDEISETRSLFRIGTVCDVTGLTSAYVASCVGGQRPLAVLADNSGVWVRDVDGAAYPAETTDVACPHTMPAHDRAH